MQNQISKKLMLEENFPRVGRQKFEVNQLANERRKEVLKMLITSVSDENQSLSFHTNPIYMF